MIKENYKYIYAKLLSINFGYSIEGIQQECNESRPLPVGSIIRMVMNTTTLYPTQKNLGEVTEDDVFEVLKLATQNPSLEYYTVITKLEIEGKEYLFGKI
jgi:hypothetical protein